MRTETHRRDQLVAHHPDGCRATMACRSPAGHECPRDVDQVPQNPPTRACVGTAASLRARDSRTRNVTKPTAVGMLRTYRTPTRRAWFPRRQRRPLRTDCSFRRMSRPGSGITRQQRVQQRARSVLCGVRLDLARQLMLDVATRDPREGRRWRSKASHRPAATSALRNDAAFWTRSLCVDEPAVALLLRDCE